MQQLTVGIQQQEHRPDEWLVPLVDAIDLHELQCVSGANAGNTYNRNRPHPAGNWCMGAVESSSTFTLSPSRTVTGAPSKPSQHSGCASNLSAIAAT